MYYLYWIHLPTHDNILIEGYIGISKHPKYRLYEHRNKENSQVTKFLNEHSNAIQTILLVGSEDYCRIMEYKLRPRANIGLNKMVGGGSWPVIFGEDNPAKRSESRKLISQKLKGRIFKPITIERMSIAQKKRFANGGYPGKGHPNQHQPRSNKTKKIMSDKYKGTVPCFDQEGNFRRITPEEYKTGNYITVRTKAEMVKQH